jgi:hypothetical protein
MNNITQVKGNTDSYDKAHVYEAEVHRAQATLRKKPSVSKSEFPTGVLMT